MEKIGSPKRQQPPGTVVYTVADADTITSIAAQFNMVVSELKKINKLMGTNATVFPGQTLFVTPVQTSVDNCSSIFVDKDSRGRLSSIDSSGSVISSDRERHPSVSWKYDEPNGIRVRDMFCKISHTRYVTDGAGAVKGSLLITVTSVIFDPDKSDDLVKEEVADYTVAVPIENIVQMAFYTDIAAKNDTRSFASSVYRGAQSSNVSSTADLGTLSVCGSNLSEVNSGVSLNELPLYGSVQNDTLPEQMIPSTEGNASFSCSVSGGNTDNVLSVQDASVVEDPVIQLKSNSIDASESTAPIEVSQVVKESFATDSPESVLLPNEGLSIIVNDSHLTRPNCPVDGSPSQFAFDDLASVDHNLTTILENEVTLPSDNGNTNMNCQPSVSFVSPSRGQFLAGLASSRNLQHIVSQPRISETGSFIMPSHWETYCDFDCGFFSVAPEDVGLVKDVSLLPAPSTSVVAAVPTFTVGDENSLDDAAEVLKMLSNTPIDRPLEVEMTSLTPGINKQRIEIVDATSRDVLTEIFNRTAELPMYLCVRVGWLPNEKLPAIRSPMSDGENHRLQPEYWFAIPKRQVEHVYQFIHRRLPAGIYGSDDEIEPIKRGFEALSLDELKAKIDLAYRDQAMKEKKLSVADIELHILPLPELLEPSIIMNAGHLNQLHRHLLPISVGCKWTLSYSSENHGYSLQTLYNRLKDVTSPILLIIKDMYDSVFGAMLPTKLRICRECYGTGEMFLFTFSPRFKKFPWSGLNSYFINSNADGVYFGAGNGKCGLYIDAELNHGRSESCETFNNDPLEPQIDFLARQIEVWSFSV